RAEAPQEPRHEERLLPLHRAQARAPEAPHLELLGRPERLRRRERPRRALPRLGPRGRRPPPEAREARLPPEERRRRRKPPPPLAPSGRELQGHRARRPERALLPARLLPLALPRRPREAPARVARVRRHLERPRAPRGCPGHDPAGGQGAGGG